MSQADEVPTWKRAKINPADVEEGDRVVLGINLHGSTDDYPGVEYHEEALQSGVEGTVVERPRERWNDDLRDGVRLMVDFAVETPDGERYTWNVDNGYVLGYHPKLDRRSDIGKFGGFYDPSEF